MKSSIKRWAAWILVGILLFNLVPVDLTLAGEKASVGEQGISVEESAVGEQDVVGDEIAVSDQDKTTEGSVADDSDTSNSAGDTQDKQPDNSGENTDESVGSTQENTTENVNQNDSDTADNTEKGTTEKATTENDTTREDAETITTEQSTEIQDVTEEQNAPEQGDSDKEKELSSDDKLNPLAVVATPRRVAVEGNISSVTIYDADNKPVNLLEASVPPNVKNGAKLEFTFNYKIKNSDNLKTIDTCYYNLALSGVTLKGSGDIFDNDKKKVGEWTFTDGTLEFSFTDEEFLKSNVTGKIELEGTVNLKDAGLKDDGFAQIRIDDTWYDIHVNQKDCPAELNVIKTAGVFEYNNGLYKATYTVTIQAASGIEECDVKFVDQLDSAETYLWIDKDSITATTSTTKKTRENIDWDWNAEDNTYNNTASPFWKGFRGTIHGMKPGEMITITYTVCATPVMYDASSKTKPTGKNTFTATDRFGRDVTASADFPDYPVTVAKTGAYDAQKGTVTWTITVSNPNGIDLGGIKVHDVYTGSINIYTDDSLRRYIKVNGEEKEGFSAVSFISGIPYEFRSGDVAKEYRIECTLEVKDTYKNGTRITAVNGVEVMDKNIVIEGSYTSAEVGIGPVKPAIEKRGELVSGTDNQIEWIVTFKVPSGGLESPVIHDEYDDTMVFDSNSVKITDPNGLTLVEGDDYVVDTNQTTDTEGKSVFEIQFNGRLEQGTYTVTYRTTYDIQKDIDNNVKKYNNYAAVMDGDNPVCDDDDTVDMAGGLGKTAVNSSGGSTKTYYGTTVQTWQLKIEQFVAMHGGPYIIKDTWDSGYEYVGSIKAHSNTTADKSGNEVYNDIQGVKVTNNGIEFDVTGAIEYANENGWKNLYITYQTRMKESEEQKLLNNQQDCTITNSAVLYDDGTPVCISPDATVTVKPKDVVYKVGNYSRATAPYAEYAINVNRGGNDLLKTGDTLVVKDTLPKDFVLVEDSLQVYHISMGNNTLRITTTPGEPLGKSEWSYTYTDNILMITIPDETEVLIKYNVIVKKDSGDTLDVDNATNSVELVGVELNKVKDDYSIESSVYESKATAVSTTAALTIHKYDKAETDADNTKGLAGAEFQVRMVDYDSATGNITDPAVNMPQGYTDPAPLTTDDKGNCTVNNLYFDHLYKVVETKAPQGYILDNTPKYFVVVGHDNATSKEDAIKLYPSGTEVYSVEDLGVMSIGNEKEETNTTESTTEITTEEKTTEERTTEEKTTEEKTTEEKTTTTNSKKTGDNSPIGALAGLMVFGTTTVVFIRKRKKKLINN